MKNLIQKPLISIGIVSYNQESTIIECVESILQQETKYPYEIVISDDCSTDNTQEVIKELQKKYITKIKVLISNKNEGIGKNYKKLFHALSGKYIMICEGDDYWINPLKIEHQINYMENHSEFGFISGRVLNGYGDYFKECPCFTNWDGPNFKRVIAFPDFPLSIDLYDDVFKYAIGGPITHTSAICFKNH